MDQYLPMLTVVLGGMFFTTLGLCVRYGYKSKCARVECCCISIERNIPEEVREDLRAIQHGIPVAPSASSLQRASLDGHP
jgi:hypothetical protein